MRDAAVSGALGINLLKRPPLEKIINRKQERGKEIIQTSLETVYALYERDCYEIYVNTFETSKLHLHSPRQTLI